MAYTTRTTVIAAYRNLADAEAAAQELQQSGVAPHEVTIQRPASEAGQYGSTSTNTSHEGGIAGWFKSLLGSDDAARDQGNYERALNEGTYLLTVDATEDLLDQIEPVLNRHNPVNIHSDRDDDLGTDYSSAGSSAGMAGSAYDPSRGTQNSANAGRTTPVGASGANAGATGENTQSIPVVQEELQVGKRRVLRGGVRVYSRVVQEQVNENVDLREEHVRVDRRPVDRAATDADFATSGREQVVEVQEFAEQPVVSKQARVVEEVRIGKDVTNRTENVSDTLRHTEVNVEQIPAEGRTGTTAGAGSGAYDDTAFRQDFATNYGSSGGSYEAYSPAYRYGYDAASDPRYRGKRFEDIESNLRTDYASRYPGSSWDKFKNAVRTGWNKVTNKV